MKLKALLLIATLSVATSLLALTNPAFAEIAGDYQAFSIVIENAKDGGIYILRGETVLQVGRVLVPVTAVNENGFTASQWGKDGAVCATAVNAIHVKVRNHPETGRGVIFSILPREFLNIDPEQYKSYLSKNTSLFTDIPAGTGIFGAGWAPAVGTPVHLAKTARQEPQPPVELEVLSRGFNEDTKDASARLLPMPTEYVPSEGDVLIIRVAYPRFPIYLEFENKFGGLIRIKYAGKEPEAIGQVLKPVAGVGRFEGTTYARVGRIRANHPGVIDISTSPFGEIGGFQIIPREHAMSPEMTFARTLTQWMVVGPLDALAPSWEGQPPLFDGFIFPCYIPLLSDAPEHADFPAINRLLSRFYVLAKMRGNNDWGPLPTVTGRNDTALVDLEAIRIYFPMPVKPGIAQ